MTLRPRRNHSGEFKSKVTLTTSGGKKLGKLSAKFDIHQNQILDWKNQLIAALT